MKPVLAAETGGTVLSASKISASRPIQPSIAKIAMPDESIVAGGARSTHHERTMPTGVEVLCLAPLYRQHHLGAVQLERLAGAAFGRNALYHLLREGLLLNES